MAYLGRKGASAALTTADIPDNSITSAKIVDGAVAVADLGPNSVDSSELVDGSIDTSHIGDDQVTGDKLANDIAISTSGAITTTGAFTSVGIDDNADANAITIDSSERVGINATSPRTKLEIVQSAFGAGEGLRLAKTLSEYWDFDIFADSGNKFAISNYNAGQVMTMNNDGYIGIGTTNPSYPVYIDVDHNNDHAMRLDNRNSSSAYGLLIKFQNTNHNDTTHTFVSGYDAAGAEFQIYSDGSFYQNSDRRTKENIVDVESMLDKINSLKVKTYNRIGDVDKGQHIGLISQDVEEIFPHLVTTSEAKDAVLDEDGNIKDAATEERKALYKIGLIFPLIKAVQELSAKNDALEAENTALKTRMDALEARVTALEG